MNKKVKILVVFNWISYLFMAYISYIISINLVSKLDNKIKFVIGNIPLILVAITSFILATDNYKEFRNVKKEAILDWIIRIITFGIAIEGPKNFNNKYTVFIFIISSFIINSVIEYMISKKVVNQYNKISNNEKIEISYAEKSNLKSIVKSINLGMFSIIIFCAGALSVPINKNMEGATSRWYIPVVASILVFIWFLKINYKNYMGYFLDKKYGMSVFIRDGLFSSIGYAICLTLSFFNFRYEVYCGITLIGILFTLPTINTIRKMSLRLKLIRNSLDKDTYNYFLTKIDS